MAKYRKKPVVIEAEEYKFGMEDGFINGNLCIPADGEAFPKEVRSQKYPRYHCSYEEQIDEIVTNKNTEWKPYIDTLEGKHMISPGDYIITGIRGERYPIKPDIFKETYEPAEEANFNSLEEIIKICNQILPYVDDGLAVYIEKILELAKEGQNATT